MPRIRVVCVDDSALMRKLLTEILCSDPEIEVVGTAPDPFVAREKIKLLSPDVVTLDVEMPRMDGLTFLRNLMRLRPTPVVMVSSLTERGADVTLQALALGAVDFVSKPKLDLAAGLSEIGAELIEKVKIASKARLRAPSETPRPSVAERRVEPSLAADVILKKSDRATQYRTTDRLIAIGSSTGGTEAVKDILRAMPASAPGVVVAQHIPGAFSKPWAARMDGESAMRVAEAEDGREIRPGHVYIAPGTHHLLVERSGARWLCRLSDGPPVNRHRPSVDVLFRSVATAAGANAVGVILTGMGEDGARGLVEMKEAGALTIAQDEATSVVWGMPGTAVKLGATETILPLERIAAKLLAWSES